MLFFYFITEDIWTFPSRKSNCVNTVFNNCDSWLEQSSLMFSGTPGPLWFKVTVTSQKGIHKLLMAQLNTNLTKQNELMTFYIQMDIGHIVCKNTCTGPSFNTIIQEQMGKLWPYFQALGLVGGAIIQQGGNSLLFFSVNLVS